MAADTWGLAISGGGAKGAFAAGAIRHLMAEKGMRFDLVSGTSTGALIAPFVVAGEVAELLAFYENVREQDILSRRPLLLALLLSDAFADSEPLRALIDAYFGSERFYDHKLLAEDAAEMFITTVNLQTGKLRYFSQKHDPKRSILKAILASASMPVYMPPVDIGPYQFVDGGVKEIAPVSVLIDHGATRIVSIVLSPARRRRSFKLYDSVKAILGRTVDLFAQEVVDNDIGHAELINDGVRFGARLRANARDLGLSGEQQAALFAGVEDPFAAYRIVEIHTIRPDVELGAALEFNPEKMKRMVDRGIAKARARFP